MSNASPFSFFTSPPEPSRADVPLAAEDAPPRSVLDDPGVLAVASREVRSAVAAVRRTDFLRSKAWVSLGDGVYKPVNELSDKRAWYTAAQSHRPLVTAWDDEPMETPNPAVHLPSDALPPASLVERMVLELGIPSGPGTRVLEVGTGSGYTAALLAHMMGPGAVTSVEINPVVAALAERRLARLHIPVRVAHGAGLDYRHDGRFERVLVTCGLRTIPHSLIRSVEPGGVLLVPFGPAFMNAQVLVRFTVAEHRRVHGRVIGPVVQDALPWSFDARHALPAQWSPRVPTRHAAVRLPQDFMPPGFPLGLFVTGLRVRHLHGALSRGAAGQRILTLRDTDPAAREPSLAHIAVGPGRSHATVTEYGPRPPAEEVLAAYEWWRALGKPALSTFKITVTAKGTRVWLDTPAKSWPL